MLLANYENPSLNLHANLLYLRFTFFLNLLDIVYEILYNWVDVYARICILSSVICVCVARVPLVALNQWWFGLVQFSKVVSSFWFPLSQSLLSPLMSTSYGPVCPTHKIRPTTLVVTNKQLLLSFSLVSSSSSWWCLVYIFFMWSVEFISPLPAPPQLYPLQYQPQHQRHLLQLKLCVRGYGGGRPHP